VLLPLLMVLSDTSLERHESDELWTWDSGDDLSASTSGKGEQGRGVRSDMVGGAAGRLAASVGERGSKSVFSLMLMIIFSRPSDVMCFSLPRLRLSAESSAPSARRLECRGNVAGLTVCLLSASSDAAESTLEDNDGTSFALGCRRKTRIAGVVARCGCASQQKVSLFHNLQLRFSSRLPSSIDSAHFEKTIHIPKRLSTFLGSTLCILAASTVRTGAAKREGIAAASCGQCASCRKKGVVIVRRVVGWATRGGGQRWWKSTFTLL
jgi:hypothetical protein